MPKKGQVLVEMMLILPVFFTIIFGIMELGYIAFQTIVLNHASYEVARIGAMTRTSAVSGMVRTNCEDLKDLMHRMLGAFSDVSCTTEQTGMDAQAGIPTYDLLVTGTNRIKLLFPISSLILAKPPGSGRREISVVMRMPIEQPLQY